MGEGRWRRIVEAAGMSLKLGTLAVMLAEVDDDQAVVRYLVGEMTEAELFDAPERIPAAVAGDDDDWQCYAAGQRDLAFRHWVDLLLEHVEAFEARPSGNRPAALAG